MLGQIMYYNITHYLTIFAYTQAIFITRPLEVDKIQKCKEG